MLAYYIFVKDPWILEGEWTLMKYSVFRAWNDDINTLFK